MRHRTFLTFDSPGFDRTYTARCETCDWTAPRLDLAEGCAAAFAHEAAEGLTQPAQDG